MIHCAKCQTVNPPELRYCQKCHSDLLPGEGIITRIIYLLVAGLLTALGVFVLLRINQGNIPVDLDCALSSPIFWGILVVITPIAGIGSALRRTPHYKRYLARAQRHTSLDPNQALADLDQALALAPPKEQAAIYKARSSLYQKLGMQKEAIRDRIEYTQSENAYPDGAAIGGVAGDFVDGVAKGMRDSNQQSLLEAGEAIAVGYCKKCKDVVELDSKLHCKTHPRIRASEVRLAIPEDLEKTSSALLESRNKQAQKFLRRRLVTLAGLIVACLGLVYLANLFGKETEPTTPATHPVGMLATVAPKLQQESVSEISKATEQTFDEGGFRFTYPAGWQMIREKDKDKLLNTSLKGIDANQIGYLGGVYHDGLNNCSGCAQIVIVALEDPALTGRLTDEQFEAAKQANQDNMGDRLLEYDLTRVGSFPATESKHIGRSGDSQLWELIIIPSTPGLVYLFSMSSAKEDYSSFESQFQSVLDSLEVSDEKDQSAQLQATDALTVTEKVELKATVLKESINLRAGPGTGQPVVGSLQKGQEISVHGRNEAGDWLCTNLENGDQAWVSRPLVSLDGDIQELPLEKNTP